YITSRVTEVRGVQFVNNVINGNRGQYQNILDTDGAGAFLPDDFADGDFSVYKPCRDGNGISMENSGRVEDVVWEGNDFRQNFNNGVCIANRGDFTRSSVLNNKFHNNGFGNPIAVGAAQQAPYGDGFGVYHDDSLVDPGTGTAVGIDGFRIENITFSGNDYRENGRFINVIDNNFGTFFGFGFGVFLRTERQEISRITFENEVARRNRLGGFRLETDTDEPNIRSGDIREITYTNVQAIESGGDPQRGGIGPTGAAAAVEVIDNGDGIAHVTDNGDIANISVTNVEGSNNGGSGLRLESDATGKGLAPACILANPAQVGDNCALNRAGDIDEIAIKDSTFNQNGD
ncbi:MAG: hypothetical protein RMJ96_08580, partial [Candidatus Bipolaricaulota bacterium]|nr:hypothetical protein [Candidatus Bipolaricaulota bacterium]